MSDMFSLHDFDDDVLDNLTENYYTDYSCFNGDFDFSSSSLCIPQDPIEDIDFFPSFVDNPISSSDLKDFEWCSDEEKVSENRIQTPPRVAFRDFDINGGGGGGLIGSKKQRSKREGKRAWSMKEMSVATENEEPIGGGDGGVSERRCSHCETTKTPQWRIGPLGPKTLCNACGVRYKSGRLLPEYRPAASPTFDGEKYSNFHRKILKKRGLMQ